MQKKLPACCSGEVTDRRGFLHKSLAVASAGLAVLVPTAVGVATFLNPLRQKGQAGQWKRLATLDTLPSDGTPQRVPVIADRTDAWTRFPAEPVGAVFLRRIGDGAVAFQAMCPHQGCPLSYDSEAKCFACPCHLQPRFHLSGKRIDGEKSFSPRDMDSLKVEIRNRNEVWVDFRTFRGGISEKVALG
ncbi:MAG: Rieske 2Fe-2S domain-containing protein [Thermoguttaceae bacterium]